MSQNITQEEIEYIKDHISSYLSKICELDYLGNHNFYFDDARKIKLKKIAYSEMMFQLKGYKTPLCEHMSDLQKVFIQDTSNRNKVLDTLKIRWSSIDEILPKKEIEDTPPNNKILFDLDD